jgi:hypothetical protein
LSKARIEFLSDTVRMREVSELARSCGVGLAARSWGPVGLPCEEYYSAYDTRCLFFLKMTVLSKFLSNDNSAQGWKKDRSSSAVVHNIALRYSKKTWRAFLQVPAYIDVAKREVIRHAQTFMWCNFWYSVQWCT